MDITRNLKLILLSFCLFGTTLFALEPPKEAREDEFDSAEKIQYDKDSGLCRAKMHEYTNEAIVKLRLKKGSVACVVLKSDVAHIGFLQAHQGEMFIEPPEPGKKVKLNLDNLRIVFPSFGEKQ